MFKSVYLLFIFCLLLSMVSCVCAEDVNTTMVNETNIDSFNYLNKIVANNPPGNEIVLDRDFYFNSSGDEDFVDGVPVDGDLVVDGCGHTIDGAFKSRIFYLSNGNLFLKNICFVNANSSEGSVVFISDFYSNVNVLNCSFINNSAFDNGGVFSTTYLNNIQVNNSIFINNSGVNGGVCFVNTNSSAEFNNCSFLNNIGAYGGVLYADFGDNFIRNSLFKNNRALCLGGGVYSKTRLHVLNSYFEGNVNLDICSPEGFFNINNTFIKDNYTDFFVNLTQNNGILELNESLSATASVIINGSNTRFMGNGFSINNTCGGYCLFFVNGDNVTFRDVIFNGAGVVVFCDNVHFINCSFINSTHNSIYSLKSTVIIENCNFTNSSSDDGGGVYAEDCNIIIFKSYFKDCWCGGDGGAVKLVSCNYTRIYHSIFINCTSLYDGGGLNLGSCSNSIVFNSSFYNNTCINGSGGGICSVWSECNITNSLFTNNTGLNGGGVYYSNCDKSQITLSTFNSNCAVNGSAVYYFWTRNGNILNSNFTNQTIGYGDDSYGDIINSRFTRTTKDVVCGDAVVYNCTYNNESFNKYGNLSVFKTFRDLYNLLNNNNDTCIVLDCDYVFMLNDNIEGVFISKNLTVDGDNHFVDGRYKSRLFKTIDCNIVFKNIILKNARIPYLGGAIYSQSGSITIINSSLIDNVAQNGAGVYTKTGDITIINSTFTDNHLFDFSDSGLCNGGGIYTDTGDVNINNTLFTSNSALNGGGVYVKTGKTVIYNSRFIDNSAENATSIYCLNNNLNIYNSIFDKTQNMEIITKNIQILNCTFNGTVIPKIPENKPVRVVLTLTAGKKTFKSKVKTKKYTIYLKYKTKGISNLLVYLKINGKTFKAKTNSKGKAVFKIKKITKKKTYKAKITYNGNSKYYSVKKTVKIKIK